MSSESRASRICQTITSNFSDFLFKSTSYNSGVVIYNTSLYFLIRIPRLMPIQLNKNPVVVLSQSFQYNPSFRHNLSLNVSNAHALTDSPSRKEAKRRNYSKLPGKMEVLNTKLFQNNDEFQGEKEKQCVLKYESSSEMSPGDITVLCGKLYRHTYND